MKLLREVTADFEQKGHRSLLMTLLIVILANPVLLQHDKFQWLLAVVLMLVLLAAVRTVANQARQYHVALILEIHNG